MKENFPSNLPTIVEEDEGFEIIDSSTEELNDYKETKINNSNTWFSEKYKAMAFEVFAVTASTLAFYEIALPISRIQLAFDTGYTLFNYLNTEDVKDYICDSTGYDKGQFSSQITSAQDYCLIGSEFCKNLNKAFLSKLYELSESVLSRSLSVDSLKTLIASLDYCVDNLPEGFVSNESKKEAQSNIQKYLGYMVTMKQCFSTAQNVANVAVKLGLDSYMPQIAQTFLTK